jgi:signal transduction histidine kinase/CHASE2 domain-containing sensor protein
MFRWLISLTLTLGLCMLFYLIGMLDHTSDLMLGALFQTRGERQTSQQIVLIGVDQESISQISPWPFPRVVHAELLKRLRGARAIGFDFLFADETAHDPVFNQEMAASPPVVLATGTGHKGQPVIPARSLSGYFSTGAIDTVLSRGGSAREIKKPAFGHTFSQAMLAAGGADIPAVNADQFVNYYGPAFTFLYLSYLDVLNGKYPNEFFAGRYVLIGAQALGIGDNHMTPLSSTRLTPGIEIQATLLNNLMDQSWIISARIPFFIVIVYIGLWMCLWQNLSERINLMSVAFHLMVMGCTAFILFSRHFFLDLSFPLIGICAAYISHLIIQEIHTASQLVKGISFVDRQLQNNLDKVFVHPPQDKRSARNPVGRKHLLFNGMARHFARLQDSSRHLSLQNNFINHLLHEEAPPLAIWGREDGRIIIGNTGFTQLWHLYHPDGPLPDFGIMEEFILAHSLTAKQEIKGGIEALKAEKAGLNLDICTNAHGKRQFFHVTIQALSPEKAGLLGYLASFTDVTQIHELERAKRDILSLVSHELRLPLTVILGYGQMLKESLPEGPQAGYAREINNQTRRLNEMIKAFLDIERLESGHHAHRPYPFDIRNMVEEGKEVIRHGAEKKHMDICLSLPARTSPFMGDEPLLLQAYLNLLDNAVKFSPEGSRIEIGLQEHPRSMVLSVADQGPGIPEAEQAGIFSKFSRGADQKETEGFGLGLSLVDQVVKCHKGSVRISQPENWTGAIFTIILPKTSID